MIAILSLVYLCDLNIKDSFYYGAFDKYNIIIDKKTGFFNATHICIKNYKKLHEWLNIKNTIKLIKYYNNLLFKINNKTTIINYKINDNYDNISGIYLHPMLLKHLITWISNTKINNINVVCINSCVTFILQINKLLKKILLI
ncbi:N1R/p28-like protein [Choristoneura biennis entomopoxvirus]|uniref:N1R/p28-like protein n=1 Tax=Choristoneura biennis entomopoxvirus TaxID=10288 RepID=A0A916NXV8_CBEPV|nr:N1R/p28-like protein [Choristoneura biennis entomopoxvirus]CCU55723.1 N1R/p28-like protein [Choristoneura biennis entomopoxvirus]